jgi:hypothetical protein
VKYYYDVLKYLRKLISLTGSVMVQPARSKLDAAAGWTDRDRRRLEEEEDEKAPQEWKEDA